MAAIGAVTIAVGYVVDPARAAAAYLVAFGSALAVVLGALALVMIARVTAANWFVALRRQAEQVAAVLPAFALLFIPVLLSVRLLYPWAGSSGELRDGLPPAAGLRAAYLNVPFFTARAIVYFAVWIAIGEGLRRVSLAQDRGDRPELGRRMYALSAGGLVAFALTLSFAAIDWFMSLTPGWYSTIYGIDYFAGGMVGALALLTVVVARGRRRDALPAAVGAEHFHALAKLLLTFVLFWVYIGFSQLIVIWSAQIPAERVWYAVRMRGGWRALGAVLLLGHFALPFCALLIRDVKRSIVAMSGIGALLLVMHYLDSYWVVMPDAPFHAGWGFLLDAGAVLFVSGTAVLVWSMRRAGERDVAIGDPRLGRSLEYVAR
jgi:hypothetical protein